MTDKKIVLAVDDVSENLTIIRGILQNYFDIRLAKSAKMAMALLETTEVDLILLDIEMPTITGFEFLKQMMIRFPRRRKPPVIFVTSHAAPDIINQALNSGARDYIVKPLKAGVLLKKIDAVIGLPQCRKNPLSEKLDALRDACLAGDSSRADMIAKEMGHMAQSMKLLVGNKVEEIEKLVHNIEYEKVNFRIEELLKYLEG